MMSQEGVTLQADRHTIRERLLANRRASRDLPSFDGLGKLMQRSARKEIEVTVNRGNTTCSAACGIESPP